MKSESEPISDDEWLLRRVRHERFRTDNSPIISPNAFEPRIKGRDVDTDGISLFRASCLQSPDDILAAVDPSRHGEYAIVRIPMTLLKELQITAKPSPIAEIKGHVVISELNAAAYQADKAKFTAAKLALAEAASAEGNILRRPCIQ